MGQAGYEGGDHSGTQNAGINNVISNNQYKKIMQVSIKIVKLIDDSATDLTKDDLDLVSVIIPIYNQKNMIKYVIDSILNSTYKNIEIIAINDGSNDGTKELLDEFKNNQLQLFKFKNHS